MSGKEKGAKKAVVKGRIGKVEKLVMRNREIVLYSGERNDYISLTDIARYRNEEDPSHVVSLWLRTYATIDYLGIWEKLNNPGFKPLIYEGFKTESAKPSFWMSPQKWTEGTNAIGIFSKPGRYGGGTFAHSDIAFKFAAWVSPEFELYLITEFNRLKAEEQRQMSKEWDFQRMLTKVNYCIQTDAIKENIVPPTVTKAQERAIYASEADLLNVALFGMTAREWRARNKPKGAKAKGNIRDEATLDQLVVLSNLEGMNASLIQEGLSQGDRLVYLNKTAIAQLKSLLRRGTAKKLKGA
jgi:hypothetical protein